MTTAGEKDLRRALSGGAANSMRAFYDRLASLAAARRPALLIGMGFNFEFYDALFPLMLANIQLSMDQGDYTARYRALQALLLPYCSEFGIEAGGALRKTHRQLYAEFFAQATGAPYPERYPAADTNPWLLVSLVWTRRMSEAVACPGASSLDRAKFNAGYFWAVEHLSVEEFRLLGEAWGRLGVRSDYLTAHDAVEADHDRWAAEGALLFSPAVDSAFLAGIKAHESHLEGYYRELLPVLEAAP